MPRCNWTEKKTKKTMDEVNDFICAFVLHEKMTITFFLYRSGRIKHFP